MQLTLISIGRDRSGLFAPGVDEYVKRLAHHAKTKVIELAEAKQSGPAAREAEGAAILAKLGPRDVLVVLDERGKSLDSRTFAKWLDAQRNAGRDVAFAIGGDEGHGDAVRGRAALVLSLSAMTLPHRLARLVLAEQLYRAFTILRGEPYHK